MSARPLRIVLTWSFCSVLINMTTLVEEACRLTTIPAARRMQCSATGATGYTHGRLRQREAAAALLLLLTVLTRRVILLRMGRRRQVEAPGRRPTQRRPTVGYARPSDHGLYDVTQPNAAAPSGLPRHC